VSARLFGFSLVLSSLAFSCFSASAAELRLQQFKLPAGVAGSNSQIHPVNLLGGPELEIATVSGDGKLVIFAQSPQGYAPVQSLPLPLPPTDGQHLYYGFARVESKDYYSLVLLSPGSVTYYPHEGNLLSAAPQVLFQSKLVSDETPGPVHRYFDLALDMNGDGFDELLLPADNGFSISARQPDGKYTRLELPRSAYKVEEDFSFSRDIPSDPSRPNFYMTEVSRRSGTNDLLFFDANGDGRQDLIYSSTATGPESRQVERYDVFLQQDGLKFGDKPSQSFAVPYDSQADATFRDINQDGRLDAVLVRSNLDIVNPRTVVKFYIGQEEGYQIFTRETDRFVTKDPVGLVQLNDFNSDGLTDFAMTFFSYQFGSMEDIVDLAFANKIQFRLQYFLGRPKQGFPRRPDAEVPVTLNTKLENFRGNPPVIMVKDMNGDKMMDLVVRASASELQFHMSQGNFSISPSAAATLKIPEQASLAFRDINRDGLTDALVSDPKSNYFSIIMPSVR